MRSSLPASAADMLFSGVKRSLSDSESDVTESTEFPSEKRQHFLRPEPRSRLSDISGSPVLSSITIPSPFSTESLTSESSKPISPLATATSFVGLTTRQYIGWLMPQITDLDSNLVSIVADYVEGVKFPHFPPLPRTYRSSHKDIFESCKQGDLNQLRYLVEVQQEPLNAIYGFGCSGHRPIHLAAMGGHLSCVQYLLFRGVAASTPIHNGQTALCLSAFQGKELIADYLLNFHNTLPPVSFGASGPKRLCDIVRNDGLTCLHAAACGGLGQLIVRLVTEFGLDPSHVGPGDSWTPLHRAAHYGKLDAVRALIDELGVDHSPKDSAGKTPLDHAKKSNRTEVIAFLESRGAV